MWSTELMLENRLSIVGYEYNPGHLYLLFRESEKTHRKFQLIDVTFYEKTLRTEEIKFEVEFSLTHFTMAGTSAIFGGYISNEPAVLLYDQTSSQPKVLPGLFIKDMK